ncbi:rhodanese-like domain-containing protein [Oxalicibacterium flavum]|uniref:Rhodanese-like domain-containing protein n=1 Tax=Oxalicibacterium flavum TaxID=179467 RepID=A0A8J2ULU2_9BURK|nr:rhodanese-like domain-containing protein [Oxalicibacterium flavum]GGC08546.1 rhodanese-like domain-containing protein [Oxalicibacterium flavum]
MQQLTAPEVAALIAESSANSPLLLDVREPWEFQTCRIDGSVSIPMNTIPGEIDRLDRETPVVCICHHGMRSLRVAHFLEANGFTQVINLSGGIHAWAQQVDPAMPTY